jgi:large subunit ribosomal protein L17
MLHHNKIKKLGRDKDERLALMRGLAESLIVRGKIKTTEAKAKSLRPFIERLITTAKTDNLSNRRLVTSRLGKSTHTTKLFTVIAPKYASRPGGYTRIVKLAPRVSDAAKLAIIELV